MEEDKSINFAFVLVFILAFGIICFVGYKVFSNHSGSNSKEKSVTEITKELKTYCHNVNAEGNYNGQNGKCNEFECYYNEDGTVYTYDCKNSNGKAVKENSVDLKIKSNLILSTGCSSTDVNGNYSHDNLQCKNFVCTVEFYGNKYTKNCMK